MSEESEGQRPTTQQRSLRIRLTAIGTATRRIPAMAIDRLRRDSALQRRALLRTIGLTVAVTTLATIIVTVLALTSHADTASKLAAAGDVMVGATLLLAIIAALVALLAYAVSTGPPDLQVSIRFDLSSESPPNNPGFEAEVSPDNLIVAKDYRHTLTNTSQVKQTEARVLLRNDSGYSAKNPAVIVQLRAMAFFDKTGLPDTWVITDFIGIPELSGLGKGYISVQWDGGPTYSIHGHSTRRLPDLNLRDLWTIPRWGLPELKIVILADGYRKEVHLPVDFTVDGTSQIPRPGWKKNPDWI